MAQGPKKGAPSINVRGTIPKLSLEMPLDEERIQAIHKCLENGHLSIHLSEVDLAAGRLGEAYLYD
jgi:hypothetical protein